MEMKCSEAPSVGAEKPRLVIACLSIGICLYAHRIVHPCSPSPSSGETVDQGIRTGINRSLEIAAYRHILFRARSGVLTKL